MKIKEHIFGLFPTKAYSFPLGNYNINSGSVKKITLSCLRIMFLEENKFKINEELLQFYNQFIHLEEDYIKRFPVQERENFNSIIIEKDYFETVLEDNFKENKEFKENIHRLASHYFHLSLCLEHEFEKSEQINAIDFIKNLRNDDGIKKAKKLFFNAVNRFQDYVLILRSPYVDVLDSNFTNIHHISIYFLDLDGNRITEVYPVLFHFYSPKNEVNAPLKVQEFFDKEKDVPIENLFMAKAKVFIRLHNYYLAIIHAVIALEIVVPRFINSYLKSKDVDKDTIKDFDNKFGLSVRVKAMLKVILPKNMHSTITDVGTIIKYRNQIMHEAKTNAFFENVKVEDLILNCEKLITYLISEEPKMSQGSSL